MLVKFLAIIIAAPGTLSLPFHTFDPDVIVIHQPSCSRAYFSARLAAG